MLLTVIGEKGTGKTWMLAWILRQLAGRERGPIFIHDARRQMPGAVGRLARGDACYRDTAEFWRRGVVEGKRGPRLRRRANLFWHCPADEVCALAKRWMDRWKPCIVVIDELDRLPPVLRQGKDAAYDLLHYGRPVNVHVLGSARAPQNIDKQWLSQADAILFGRCSTLQLLRQVRQSGWPGAESLADELPALPDRKFVLLKG